MRDDDATTLIPQWKHQWKINFPANGYLLQAYTPPQDSIHHITLQRQRCEVQYPMIRKTEKFISFRAEKFISSRAHNNNVIFSKSPAWDSELTLLGGLSISGPELHTASYCELRFQHNNRQYLVYLSKPSNHQYHH